ncbi:MAG: CopG family transcriptional regulator [Cephaloticoccus sp.]|nr:CopG family transcriptional regulator [Cephaloticoccus sp.]MCF7760399.1 CopG family transcriptional regulator [Cephaloticoccus sp.]
MATRPNISTTPVTFDLPLDLLAKIEACRKTLGSGSASAVIRAALERFDFAACQPQVTPHRQISVRLSLEQRTTLKRFAKIKGVSVGELLRMAVEDLPRTKPKVKPPVAKRAKKASR